MVVSRSEFITSVSPGAAATSVSATAPIVPRGSSSRTVFTCTPATGCLKCSSRNVGKIARCHGDIFDAARRKSLDVIVYDCLALNLQQRLGSGEGGGRRRSPLPPGHEHSLHRQQTSLPRQVNQPRQATFGVKFGNECDAEAAEAAKHTGVGGAVPY